MDIGVMGCIGMGVMGCIDMEMSVFGICKTPLCLVATSRCTIRPAPHPRVDYLV